MNDGSSFFHHSLTPMFNFFLYVIYTRNSTLRRRTGHDRAHYGALSSLLFFVDIDGVLEQSVPSL
jgi:hypothetical protein